MTELTTPSRDVKRALLRTPPGVCARKCPFRALCDAASGPRATTPVPVDPPSGSAHERRQREALADLSRRLEERKLVDRAKAF